MALMQYPHRAEEYRQECRRLWSLVETVGPLSATEAAKTSQAPWRACSVTDVQYATMLETALQELTG